MELKLVVLAGAKQNLEIPLKKEKFLIGRSKECALRAGSEAISRRHCAIVRANGRWTVRDLGSRNGTFVNDQRITEEVPLTVGDELRVGPLKFRVAPIIAAEGGGSSASSPARPGKRRKQPPVKNVADVMQRTVSKAEDSTTEDDISRWLLGVPDPKKDDTLKETRTIRLEETTLNRKGPVGDDSTVSDIDELVEGDIQEEPGTEHESADDAAAAAEKSGSWSLFKRGKPGADKKQPGKLPPRPDAQSKDSREAAADILREMTRRR